MNPEKRLAEKLLADFKVVMRDRCQVERIEAEFDAPIGSHRADVLLSFLLDGDPAPFKVLVEVKRTVFPRDIEGTAVHLAMLHGYDPTIDERMVWSESLSEGARKQLEARDIAYFDGSGSLNLKLRHRHFLIDRPPIKPHWKGASSIFTPERARVLHALLVGWGAWRTGIELAETSGASANTVSVLMRELEKRRMVLSTGNGRSLRRQLVEPEALLEAWASQWAEGKSRRSRWFAFTQNPENLPSHLASRLEPEPPSEWAFTGQYAANTLAPILTAVNGYDLIVPVGTVEHFAKRLDLKPAEKGFNVTLHECDDFALQHRFQRDDRLGWFSSPVMQYLELSTEGGRSKELARELKEKWLSTGLKHG